LRISPVARCLLQLGHSLLESLFLADKKLDLGEGILAGEVFEDHEPLPQVFVLVLQLEDLGVLVVDQLGLLLNGLA
jgi:hypothetical protein